MTFERYLEGLAFRAIGRILKISYGAVYQLLRKSNAHLEFPDRKIAIEMVELDEIHSYVGRKKLSMDMDCR